MKAWKAVAIATFAFIAVALVTTSVLAISAGGQKTNGSNGGNGVAQGSRGGMMNGPMRGMMGYSQYNNNTSSNGNPQQFNSGCKMRNGWP